MKVSTELAQLSRTIDPQVLGQRIKAARVAAGFTQSDLAGRDASTAYVSRIESGQRRPELKLLLRLAERLGATLEQLLMGFTSELRDQVRLEVDYAELALRSGRGEEALERAVNANDLIRDTSMGDLLAEARLVEALALEALGRVDDAIIKLEDLVDDPSSGNVTARAAIALTRCYRESGDLARSIERGEALLQELVGLDLHGTTEAVQLTVTIAASHFERGDVGHAVRICRRAITRAEESGSASAQASAYWNASIMASEQGHIAEAIPMAQRALALLDRDADTRTVARLRSQLGIFMLSLDPPELQSARLMLETAARELDWSSASPGERANNQLALARALLLADEVDEASEMLSSALSLDDDATPMVLADTHVLLGQVAARRGHTELAREHYQEAAQVLTGMGADRRAAQLWFELGGLLEATGDQGASGDAFRRAAVSAGVVAAAPAMGAVHRPTPA